MENSNAMMESAFLSIGFVMVGTIVGGVRMKTPRIVAAAAAAVLVKMLVEMMTGLVMVIAIRTTILVRVLTMMGTAVLATV
jgi:hypothetical protein